jgi:hypothetical protein
MEGGVRMSPALRALQSHPGETDRVRAHSADSLNTRVDREGHECVEACAAADRDAVTAHLQELDREWDVERYLQMNAGLISLAGVVLGAAVDRRLLVLPAAIYGFLFQHGVQGWCPPLPVFRRLGVRTRREINRERYALKALRGDFASLRERDDADRERG